MNTRKSIATISYNSVSFLKMKLNELINNHTISFYMFIQHEPEGDECAGKKHIHLYIEPNKKIDTMDLQDYLKEFDPSHPKNPLGCINFNVSKVDDWILYCFHYPAYLASKFQSREYIYNKSDFVSSDANNFESLYFHAFHGSEWAKRNQVLRALNDGDYNPSALIENGTIPLSMASQLNAFMYMKKHFGVLDRNGRISHDSQLKTLYSSDEYLYMSDKYNIIDNLDNSDIIDLSDKVFQTDVNYRLNR